MGNTVATAPENLMLPADLDAQPDFIVTSHSVGKRATRSLAMLVLVLLAARFLVPPTGRISNFNLHAIIEIGIGLIGLLTGFSIILRFHTKGRRFHLFLGLAFFINGVADVIHGAMCLPGIVDVLRQLDPQKMPAQSFRSSQLMMGLTLGAALFFPKWLGKQRSPLLETLQISLIVLAFTAISTALPVVLVDPRTEGATDPFAVILLLSIGTMFLLRYIRHGDVLTWWIAMSVLANFLGQTAMFRHAEPFDGAFCLAQLYKFLGYLLPLFGFCMYQIVVNAESERTQRQLIDAREEALSATRAKSEFLANISHEIRTPMNAIIGMTNQLLRSDLPGVQRERVEDVRNSGRALLTLLNDILDFSKLEVAKVELDLSAFRLRDSVEDAVKSLAVTAHEKHLTMEHSIDSEVPDYLIGDSGRLRQILVNLISNAIKFTEQGGISIHFAVQKLTSDGAELHATVRDTGIGIPPEKQGQIFQAFVQADGTTTRRYGGTGLGLTIAAKHIELMNGKIWVESEVGKGSAFHFTTTFPIALEGSEELAASDHDLQLPLTENPRRILVAEDNLINRKLVQSLLREMGHEPILAGNGQEAIELLDDVDIHLVLMDLQMPVLGGMEATSIIRERERGTDRHIPIVALTADILPVGREQCLAAGMDGYLTKPLDERELFATIERQALKPAPSQKVSTEITSEKKSAVLRTSVGADAIPKSAGQTGSAASLRANGEGSPDLNHRVVLNRERLMSQLKGDQSLLSELVELFSAQSDELVRELRRQSSERNLTEMGAIAHKLSGSLASLHAERALFACRKIEQRSLTIEDARSALADLEIELGKLRPVLMEAAGITAGQN